MMSTVDEVDVLVVGGGNAGLCAALAAGRAGASVLVLESAPRALRGGNTRHTRNLRCAHDSPTDVLTDRYSADELLLDLVRVNDDDTDQALAELVARESASCPAWMAEWGARFQRALRGTLQLSRTNAFFLGGGTALLNSYYAAAERLGVRVAYDSEVTDLTIHDGKFEAALVRSADREHAVRAAAIVLASGGFESDLAWLKEAWGDAANNFIIRGTPHNRGTVLKMLRDAGALCIGDPRECHAVAVDGRAPKFDGGIVTRIDSVPLGVVVNSEGERFYDEGEDYWPKRYAIWGKLVARQPGQIAFAITDSKVRHIFMPSAFPPVEADSLDELADALDLPRTRLKTCVEEFNRAVQPGTFDPTKLDECRTLALTPPKSHWAQRIDEPPFWGYPLRPGITFTYLGVRVDRAARVLDTSGRPFANIYAAGEIMAGNVLRKGYVAGIGMTIGTVFGRIAGLEAAAHAH